MLADVSGVGSKMSDRQKISRKKGTASNFSNPSLAPKIPRLAIPAHNDVESNNITSNNITAQKVESETSQEQALVTEEPENQENISLKSDSPIESFNYLEKISIFRPQETVQSQQLAENKQEQSEVIQRKLNASSAEDKQEELSPLSKAFQIQGNQGDSNNQVTESPIESFNYLERATIFRPQKTVQSQKFGEEKQEQSEVVQSKSKDTVQRAGDYSGLLPGHETYGDSYSFKDKDQTDFTYHHIIPENKLHLVIKKLKTLLKNDGAENLSTESKKLQDNAKEQWLSTRTTNTIHTINKQFSDFGVKLSESEIKSILGKYTTIGPIFTEVESIVKTQVIKKIKTDSAKNQDKLIKSFQKLFKQNNIMMKWGNDQIKEDVKRIVEDPEITIFWEKFFELDPIINIINTHKPKYKRDKSQEPNKNTVIEEIKDYCKKKNIEEFYNRACKPITENSFNFSGSPTLKAYLRDNALPREDQDELEDAVAWNPGNIHRGPKSDFRPNPETLGFNELLDDGGDKFEKAAQNLVQEEHYQILEKLNTDIDDFLDKYDNNDSQTNIQTATTIVEQMLAVQRQGLTEFNQEQWEEVDLNNEKKMRVKGRS